MDNLPKLKINVISNSILNNNHRVPKLKAPQPEALITRKQTQSLPKLKTRKQTQGLPKLKINVISNSIRNTLSNNHDDRDYLLENDNYIENYLENLPEAPQPEALITNLLPYQKQGLGWMLSNENPEMPTTNKAVQFWIQRVDQNKDRYYSCIKITVFHSCISCIIKITV